EPDAGPALALDPAGHGVSGHLMAEYAGQRVVHWHVERVVESDLEERRRQARIPLVARDERIECRERNGAGESRIVEVQRRYGEASVEIVALEMRHADQRPAAGAEAETPIRLPCGAAHGAVAVGPVQQTG